MRPWLKVRSDRQGKLFTIVVCGRVPWLYQYMPGGFMLLFFFVAFPWVETSTGPGGFMICVFII